MSTLNNKIIQATKWSSITEIAAKLVSPISTMVLARLLSPDNFGVLVTAVMVISFAEIFTDAGFQKYLIQKEFKSQEELYEYTNVAFWSNLIMSLFLWFLIILFSTDIATLVGNSKHGTVISVSCFCIPLTAFSSIQMALFKRALDFKTLFLVRIIGVFMPLFITIPLAYFLRSYWALIIGMIALNLSNAVLLTIKSPWKPRLSYKVNLFKNMFSFSFWSMIESISIWLTGYIDLFIVGYILNEHYLGIYRTAMTSVGQILTLITSATTPILFSALSRHQNNPKEFNLLFLQFQKFVGLLILPFGIGIYLFRHLITLVLLGDQWTEAEDFIGLWGLSSSVVIIFSHYCSEVYRAKGKPKLSVLAQVLHIICLVPVIWWAIQYSFDFLCEMRAAVRLQLVLVNLILMYLLTRLSFWNMLHNTIPAITASLIMFFSIRLLPSSQNIYQDILYVGLAVLIYFIVICCFPKERNIILSLKTYIKS